MTHIFDHLPDGRPVTAYTIQSKGSIPLEAEILDLGATVHRFLTPDRDGHMGDIVLGAASAKQILEDIAISGSIIGRYANRIKDGVFTYGGKTYTLKKKDQNFLHSEEDDYKMKLFTVTDHREDSVTLVWHDESTIGFDGAVDITVTYSLDDFGLSIEYIMTADADTPANPTNHAYFNLAGSGSVMDHELTVRAVRYTPPGPSGTMEGAIAPVKDTPLDFYSPVTLQEAFDRDRAFFPPLRCFDHNFEISGSGFRPFAELYDPKSGRSLTCSSDLPGMQLYIPASMEQPLPGKDGALYDNFCGVCMETQFFPNAVNCANFDQPILHKGCELRTVTVFTPGVR